MIKIWVSYSFFHFSTIHFSTDGSFSTNSFRREKTKDTHESTNYRLSDTARFSQAARDALETGDFGHGVQRVVGDNLINFIRGKQPDDNGWNRDDVNF